MKTKKLLLIVTIFFSVSVYADFVPEQSAKKVALNFFFEKYNQFEGQISYNQLNIRLVYTETDGVHDFFYVFQINGINVLTSIGGDFLIEQDAYPYNGNPILTSLTGLDNITTIGSLSIDNNDADRIGQYNNRCALCKK
jgi:hypothetical protein